MNPPTTHSSAGVNSPPESEQQLAATDSRADGYANASTIKPKVSAVVPPEDRVPIGEKIAFGLGGMAGNIQPRADDFLLNPVFVLTVGISPAVMSTCALVYRFWDAIADLLVGWLSDSTHSRWGRRKPYILIGSLLMAVVMPFLFFFDPNWNVYTIIAWMVAIQLIIFLFHSIWNIPYQCLLLESTPNSTERTNVAAWRGYVGVFAGLGMSWIWWATQQPIFHGPDGKPDTLNGARWIFVGIAILVFVLGLLPLFVKERTAVLTRKQPLTQLSLWQNLKLTFANRPFVMLILFAFLMWNSNSVLWSLQFFATYSYVFQADSKLASTVAGISGTLSTLVGLAGIPLFQWIANHKGKVVAVRIIMCLGLVASLSTLVFYNPNYPYLSMLPGLLMAPGNSAIWVLIPSMTGDVVDYDETSTFRRREGSYQATFSWLFKLSGSVATLITGPLIWFAGYDSTLKGVVQPEDVVFNIRMMLAFIPASLMAAAIFAVGLYPLTSDKIAEVQATLAARRQADSQN